MTPYRIVGYCYNFDLYCGTYTQERNNYDLLLGSKLVLHMLQVLKNPQLHSCLFFFKTISSLVMTCQYTCEILDSKLQTLRLHKFFWNQRHWQKNQAGGLYDYQFDTNNEVLIVKWLYMSLSEQTTVQSKHFGASTKGSRYLQQFQWLGWINMTGSFLNIPHLLELKKWYWPLFT